MTELVQCLVRGLGDGSVYALLAFGFVIIFKSMGVISFAQPSLMLAGAVLVTYLVTTMNFYLAVLVAALAVALLAMGVERTVLRPMIGKPVFVISIITLGVDIVIRVVVNAYIGLDVRPVGAPWGLATSRLLGIEVQQRHLIMFVTTMVLVAILFAFFRYSRMGLAMRAVAFDQEVALAQDSPESRFLMDAVRGDIAETKMGELAQQKGQSEGVRAFGEMLVEDHSNAMKKTAELAKDLNVIPPAQPTAEQTQKHDALARLSGAEFDQQFAAEMTKAHEEMISKYEMQARSGNREVAKHAEELLPVLEQHLAMAQRLQSGEDASHDRSNDHDRSDNDN